MTTDVSQKEAAAFARYDQLLQNLKDYTSACINLLLQRQGIFLAATILTAFYFDPRPAILFYGTIMLTEFIDLILARRVHRLSPENRRSILFYLVLILANTVLSSGAICIYAISVAFQQEAGGHFTPLFFLFAAALFAAMNNHQIVLALALRLMMYGVSFMLIVLEDIWVEQPPLSSDLWLHFFTVIFVMYFLIDCSMVFLRLYRNNLQQLETLKTEHERTKAAYLVKSQFVSTVSHELRTPLTSIKGSLDLLNSGAMGTVPEQMQGLVEMAGKNSNRLSNLIDDVLDLQKIEAGEMTYRMALLNVQDIVFEAVHSSLGYAETHGVTLEAICPEDEDLFIEGDENRLMQVMSNMISNAAKFSHEGDEVIVSCECIGDVVRISVQDKGVGIPDNARDKVFGRFTQLDSSDQRNAGGTGLGMNISKEIVEHMNGQIDYISELGTGSTFFVEFPVRDATEAAA